MFGLLGPSAIPVRNFGSDRLICALKALVCRGETLNLPHMMGKPNRNPRIDLEKLVFLCQFHPSPEMGVPRMGIGNENDQVS